MHGSRSVDIPGQEGRNGDRKALRAFLDSPIKLVHIHRPALDHRAPRAVTAHGIWALVLVDYHGRLRTGGVEYRLRPGTACLLAPGVRRTFAQHRPGPHRVANWSWPRRTEAALAPVQLYDFGACRLARLRQFDEALALAGTDPVHAGVKVWDLLLQIARCPAPGGRADWPAPLTQAVERIEAHLNTPLAVAHLARRSGVSHNQLTRLFRRFLGCTVVAYIRRRRMELARHLLRYTDLPIKVVAARVGIPDAHLFNKTVRRTFGMSPTALRGG